MIKRIIVVLLVAAVVILAPYYSGEYLYDWFAPARPLVNRDVVTLWFAGWLPIFVSVFCIALAGGAIWLGVWWILKGNKSVVIIVCLMGLVGCDRSGVPVRQNPSDELPGLCNKIIVFEGCEYLYGEIDRSAYLTHKGNCNNKIHSYADTSSITIFEPGYFRVDSAFIHDTVTIVKYIR